MDGNVSAYCQLFERDTRDRKIFHKGQTFLTMLLEVLHILPMQCKKKAFQYVHVKNRPIFKY